MTGQHRTTSTTRREFLKDTSRISATAILAAGLVGAQEAADDTIRVALVGCGGRGTGAAVNAASVKRGPLRIVAMADVFGYRMQQSHQALSQGLAERFDVPEERRFLGFDAYRHAMDCLRPGDVVILATPPAFRWVHFTYAIQKGLHVFMEKPVTVDGPSSRRMFALAEKAQEKNLKVAVGLMSRHSRAMQELVRRVRDGELGEIVTQQGYRIHDPAASFRSTPKPAGKSDLHYQIERFHSFLWASGGAFNDFYIHLIDQLCWMKDAWPVKAFALGGRHYRTTEEGLPYVDQNFDTYSVEYTYADGTKLMFDGRCVSGCQNRFSSFMHGTKGSAVVSANGDCGLPSTIHRGWEINRDSMVWRAEVPSGQRNPYQNEWEDFVDAIRDDTPYDEAKYGIQASLVCNMGRMAAHTGHEVTYEEMLACEHELAPGVAELTMDSPAPVMPGADGLYPVPRPGILTDREY